MRAAASCEWSLKAETPDTQAAHSCGLVKAHSFPTCSSAFSILPNCGARV